MVLCILSTSSHHQLLEFQYSSLWLEIWIYVTDPNLYLDRKFCLYKISCTNFVQSTNLMVFSVDMLALSSELWLKMTLLKKIYHLLHFIFFCVKLGETEQSQLFEKSRLENLPRKWKLLGVPWVGPGIREQKTPCAEKYNTKTTNSARTPVTEAE